MLLLLATKSYSVAFYQVTQTTLCNYTSRQYRDTEGKVDVLLESQHSDIIRTRPWNVQSRVVSTHMMPSKSKIS